MFQCVRGPRSLAKCALLCLLLVQVVLGALSLQAVETEPDTPNAMASLSTAHKMLSQVLACKDKLSQQDTAVVCWLLARTELLGNLRRKQEKAEAHVMQVTLSFWNPPSDSTVFPNICGPVVVMSCIMVFHLVLRGSAHGVQLLSLALQTCSPACFVRCLEPLQHTACWSKHVGSFCRGELLMVLATPPVAVRHILACLCLPVVCHACHHRRMQWSVDCSMSLVQ